MGSEGETRIIEPPARARQYAGGRWAAMLLCGSVAWIALACNPSPRSRNGEPIVDRTVRPGISVLLSDSIQLIKDKRVGLITNQTGLDEKGRSSVDLLFGDERATKANVKLVALFSPEHGIRGTEDRTNLPNEVDAKTGLTIHSLYQRSTISPPDSTLRGVDVLVVDLQDIGTRTWTYVGVMLFAMHAADRLGIPYVVLDRPNPLGGQRVEGVLLDTAIADAREGTAATPRNGFALWPVPLRHGLTIGEMARMFHRELGLKGRLHVVPMANWRRAMWFDDTKLPWVKPSPNLPTLTSALVYPALVPFEGTNVSVGRGTNEPFQRVGAPWFRADSVRKLLADLELSGVRFESERFTPSAPGDSKYDGQSIPGVRIHVTDRDRIQVARVGAAVLWAIAKAHGPEFTVREATVDARLGSPAMREALVSGEDPDRVVDRLLPALVTYEQNVRKYHLYR
jgi:uncharacterized protein YbbC (DUF1343 family)